MGRPTAMTPEIVRKLLDAFKLDVSVEEACLYAGISKDTFYRKLKRDEDFSDEIGRSRMYATLAARNCIVKHIATDPHLAFKYLERKRREEFGQQYIEPPQETKIDLGAEARARSAKYANPPVLLQAKTA